MVTTVGLPAAGALALLSLSEKARSSQGPTAPLVTLKQNSPSSAGKKEIRPTREGEEQTVILLQSKT